MMYGTLNMDKLCRVLERIYSERDENVEVKVSVISKEEAEERKKKKEEEIKKLKGITA